MSKLDVVGRRSLIRDTQCIVIDMTLARAVDEQVRVDRIRDVVARVRIFRLRWRNLFVAGLERGGNVEQ